MINGKEKRKRRKGVGEEKAMPGLGSSGWWGKVLRLDWWLVAGASLPFIGPGPPRQPDFVCLKWARKTEFMGSGIFAQKIIGHKWDLCTIFARFLECENCACFLWANPYLSFVVGSGSTSFGHDRRPVNLAGLIARPDNFYVKAPIGRLPIMGVPRFGQKASLFV